MSLLLIGLGEDWEEGYLEQFIFNENLGYNRDSGFLYPEQKVEINYNRHGYAFYAYDSISSDAKCNIKKEYQFEFTNIYYTEEKKKTVKSNLSKTLGLYGSGKQHSRYNTPKIYWVGDINNDGLLDFIIYQHSMVSHGGVTWSYSLFLTKKTENNYVIKMVDAAILVSCH